MRALRDAQRAKDGETAGEEKKEMPDVTANADCKVYVTNVSPETSLEEL